MEKDYTLLLKPNWFASDIARFLGCSMDYANQIKAKVEKIYGVIPLDEFKKERSVAADNVLKVIGGTDRLTEAKIYNEIWSKENGKRN